MIYSRAVEIHTAMLHACSSEELSAVVKLHSPSGVPAQPNTEPSCIGCPEGNYAETENLWEDCRTLMILNAWLHVDGFRAADVSAFLPPPPVCSADEEYRRDHWCDIHGQCTCGNHQRPPYERYRSKTCPLHGEKTEHKP